MCIESDRSSPCQYKVAEWSLKTTGETILARKEFIVEEDLYLRILTDLVWSQITTRQEQQVSRKSNIQQVLELV